MKGFFKFTGAALAVAALASCTSDDLIGGFGANTNVKGLQVTVEELIDPVTTRAAYAGSQDNKLFFEAEDQIWAFNENLTKYSFNTASGLFVCDKGDNPNLAAPVYALLQSRKVEGESKKIDLVASGWDYETNNTYAQYYIPSTISVVEDDENEGVEATKSYIPLWGTAEADEALGIKTTMKYLTAVLRLELDDVSGSANYIYVEAYKAKGGKEKAYIASSSSDRTKGYFEAVLANGEDVNEEAVESQTENYTNVITVEVEPVNRAKTYLYVPIIEGNYGLVRVSYSVAKFTTAEEIKSKATVMKVFSEIPFKRGNLYKTAYDGFVVGGETPSAISKALASRATTATSDISLTADENTHMDYMKDGESDNTIELPYFENDIAVTLKKLSVNKDTEETEADGVLYITGKSFEKKFTLNIEEVTGDVKKIKLDAENADIVLVGAFNVEVEGRARSLTIGDETTTTTVKDLTVYAETKTVTVNEKATSGTITLSDEQPKDAERTVTVKGTVNGNIVAKKKDTFKANAKIDVVVEGSVVGGYIATYGDLTVSGSINTANVEGNVTVSRASEGVAAKAIIMIGKDATLTLSGGYVEKLSTESTNQAEKAGKVTIVNTEKKDVPTAIGTFTKNTATTLVFDKSTWGGAKINSKGDKPEISNDYATTTVGSEKVIMTASQLASLSTVSSNLKLYTNMDMGINNFAPITKLSDGITFDGNYKTIEGLKIADESNGTVGASCSAGLFREIAGSVKNLTIKNVSLLLTTKAKEGSTTYVAHEGVGALAGKATGSNVTIENVEVDGGSLETNGVKSLGGLIGSSEASLLKIEAGQTEDKQNNIAKKDFTTVNLTKIKGLANLGGLVGSTSNSVTIIKYAAKPQAFEVSTTPDNYATSDPNYGTVGSYIGSLTESFTAGSVLVCVSSDGKDAGWVAHKSDAINRENLGFKYNWTTLGEGTAAKHYSYYGGEEAVGYSLAMGGTLKVSNKLDITDLSEYTKDKKKVTTEDGKLPKGTTLFNLYVYDSDWKNVLEVKN